MIDQVGTHQHIRSFQSSRVKPSHSLSYPRVPTTHAPPLVSVRSEGPATARRGIDTGKLTGQNLKPPLQGTPHTKETHEVDDSSEESGVEDELLVRIDSPSKLSFHQAP